VLPLMLSPAFARHPLLYTWSAEGQKLYAWLRFQVEQERYNSGEPVARTSATTHATVTDEGRGGAAAQSSWHSKGYLAAYATAEQITGEVLDVSRNTVTKLIQELRDRDVCLPHRVRRGGHIFLLGEWGLRHSDLLDKPFYWQAYYLDGLLEAQSLRAAPASTPRRVEKPGETVPASGREMFPPPRVKRPATSTQHPPLDVGDDVRPIPRTLSPTADRWPPIHHADVGARNALRDPPRDHRQLDTGDITGDGPRKPATR